MRITFVKPDWGFTGGFELVVGRLAESLASEGHEVEYAAVDVGKLSSVPFGFDISNVAAQEPEFARYIQLVAEFSTLKLDRADVVVSTQPPSYVVDHPQHLSLFYHHLRHYYDLSDVLVKGGHVADVPLHEHAKSLVRQIDERYLTPVPCIVAASEEAKRRLETFNGISDGVALFHAGPGFRSGFPTPRSDDSFAHVLCVSRHEFPKRTELFAHACQIASDVPSIAVGTGGRLGSVLLRTAELASGGRGLDDWTVTDWMSPAPYLPVPALPVTYGSTTFAGFVSENELDRLYRSALCVVAPAYLEDYGLTAIEAMAYGKPLIVCRDGGNLVNFVEHGVNGFIVDPTPTAIGEAIQLLADDRSLAASLGAAAREVAHQYTWGRAMREFKLALEQVMSQ